MKTFYGLSRTRNRQGEIVRRTLKPIVNCLHASCGGGYETMQVLVVEVIFNEARHRVKDGKVDETVRSDKNEE